MRKIVYNSCHGGFSLSREAVLLGREMSGDPKWCGACIIGDSYKDGTVVDRDYGGGRDLDRSDEILIAVVEKLGRKADGPCASLSIEEVDEGTQYRIDEYDGYESVMTVDDYDWKTA